MHTTTGPEEFVGYLVGIFIAALVLSLLYQAIESFRLARRGDGVERCEMCGYDLRASTDRCPECGAKTRYAYHEGLRRLREDWPSAPVAPRIPNRDEAPIAAFVSRDRTLVSLLREHLNVRGVATEFVRTPPIGWSGRAVLYRPYAIMVWTGDEELARRILADLCPPELLAESARLAST